MTPAEIQQAFDKLNAKYRYALEKLDEAYNLLNEKPSVIEAPATGDLKAVAELLVKSEFNKEDLSESEILKMLEKTSEEEVKRKMGFWAMPLPTDTTEKSTNTRYIGKRR